MQGYAVMDTGWTRSKLVGQAITDAKQGHSLHRLTYCLMYATDLADRLEYQIIPALQERVHRAGRPLHLHRHRARHRPRRRQAVAARPLRLRRRARPGLLPPARRERPRPARARRPAR